MKITTFMVPVVLLACLAVPAYAGDTLRLSDLLKEARAKNPSLSAMQYRYRAAREQVPQADALPDPMLMMGVQNLPVSSFEFDEDTMTQKMIGVSQTFPFFGKRGLKSKAASLEAKAKGDDYRETALRLEQGVKTAYFRLYRIQKDLEVLEKTGSLLDSLKKIAQSRYSVGMGNMKDIIKTQLEQSLLIDKRLSLQKDERTQRAELGALLGRGTPVEGAVEDIKPAVFELDVKALSDSAIENRPEIAAASERIKKGEAMMSLAKKAYYPDFTVSAQYMERDRQNNGVEPSDMVTALVSINLPIWRKAKLEPGVREAALVKSEAEEEKDAEANEVKAEVGSLVEQVKKDDRMIKLYKDVVIPEADEDINAGLAEYEVGKVEYIDLLDSIRTLLDYQTEYYNRIADRETKVADLEAATGRPVDRLQTGRPAAATGASEASK
ncbi:MAG: TolC family protein [Nitrospirota bacterium]